MSGAFWILNVALIEQFITSDHCQVSGQERRKAMKMPRISCQAQLAERDRHLCHSSITEVLFYLISIIYLFILSAENADRCICEWQACKQP